MTGEIERLAGVMGWPICHSLSPVLHNAWIAAANLAARYAAFPVRPDGLEQAIRGASALGLAGLNVTLPHKEEALALADDATQAARRIGAANLVTFGENGAIRADNTDMLGFAAGLPDNAFDQEARTARILGAGGAARAAAAALVEAGYGRIEIVNRSHDRATALAKEVSRWGGEGRALPWDEREAALREISLLVNATHLGMTGAAPLGFELSGLAENAVVYDVVYTPLETSLLASARKRGLRTVDGLTMLIAQAAPSFEAFFGRKPPQAVDARALLVGRLETL